MAVSVDATGVTDTQFTSVATATNTTLTVGGSATALLAWMNFSSTGNPASLVVVWDVAGANQTMTQLVTRNSGNSVSNLYGLINPVAGNKTLTANWTGARSGTLNAISFTGTATDTVANAFKNATSSSPTGTTGTLTVTGATGNIQVVGGTQNTQGWTSMTATGSTQIFLDSTAVANIGCRAPSAASLVWSALTGGSVTSALVGVDVSAPSSTAWPRAAVSFR